MNQPDPKLHQRISFVKSALRVFAGVALMNEYLIVSGALFIAAEILGVAEELV